MATDARAMLASAAGAALGGAARVVAAVRPTAKPLHPRGTTWAATLVRNGAATGVQWLDEPGTVSALVRQSRAAGLPAGWPDVHGLALRVEIGEESFADVLLASTGSGPVSRFLLRPGRHPAALFLGSLLPYRTSVGPVLLGALPREDASWDLVCAVGRGHWVPFARLTVDRRLPAAALVSFDPVLHRLPGLEQYDEWARVRLPAYRAARRSRGSDEDDGIALVVAGTRQT